jgi:hypothetical protein
VTGFGFAVLAAPLFLLFVDSPRAIQLVIIISTALSFVALPGLWRAIAPGRCYSGSAVWPACRSASSLSGIPIQSRSAC